MLRRTRLLLVPSALIGLAVVLSTGSRERGAATADEHPGTSARAGDTRVGRVHGTEAFIALTYDGRRLRAYACDGSARRPATLSKWFAARWGGRKPLTIVNEGARLRVRRLHPDGSIGGRLDGHRFRAEPATRPAGLHDSEPGRSIVLADGSVRGTLIPPRPVKCRPVMTTLADGTTTVVTICKSA